MKLLINDLHVYSSELSNIGDTWARMHDAAMFITEEGSDQVFALPEDQAFFQTITPCNENRYNASGWFEYDDSAVIETEYIKNSILDQLDYIHHTETGRSPEEKQQAFEKWSLLVLEASSITDLGSIARDAYNAIQNSVITRLNSNGEEISFPVIFPKEHLAIFWDLYKDRKAELSKAYSQEIDEIENLISRSVNIHELKTMKKTIYSEKIFFNDKKALWALCDTQIAKLA